MPFITSIGTHVPCWGVPERGVPGDDEDAAAILTPDRGLHRLTPSDIDVAEVHDLFTGLELISYEDLGFANRFEAYRLVEADVTTVGGTLPVNPSGGLKANGHPPGAPGVARCVQLAGRLRGEAANQVDGARVGLAHNLGGRRAASAVTDLEGPAGGK